METNYAENWKNKFGDAAPTLRPYQYYDIETIRLSNTIVYRSTVYRGGKVVDCRTCESYEKAVYYATH